MIRAVLALASVARVRWAFVFPPVKQGGGLSSASRPLCAQQPPAHCRRVPSWWQLASPWLPAGLSLLMLVPMPETPLLLKPSSCEQIQGRGGDGPGKQVLECPKAHNLGDQFLAQLRAPSPSAEGLLKKHHSSILSPQSARAAEGQSVSALSTWKRAQPSFPAEGREGRSARAAAQSVKPTAVNAQGSFLGLLGQVPAVRPSSSGNERSMTSLVQAHLGCSLAR